MITVPAKTTTAQLEYAAVGCGVLGKKIKTICTAKYATDITFTAKLALPRLNRVGGSSPPVTLLWMMHPITIM